MTKKRPRRTISLSKQKNLQGQNPKMVEEEPSQSQTQEDQEVQFQNPDQEIECGIDQQEQQQQQQEQQQKREPEQEEDQQQKREPEKAEEEEQQQKGEPEKAEQEEQHDQEEEEHELEGMPLSPTTIDPFAHHSIAPDFVPESPSHNASNVARKAPKRKKAINYHKRAAIEKKLQILKEKFRPIPFVPSKTLDFFKHEKLFKRLGLWEFVHLEFDRNIRTDLLASLIVSFNSTSRYSSVNDCRILVNRSNLGRALKLPVKKDKTNPSEAPDFDSETLSEEAISFIEDFVSNWVLLHEDTWMMPEDVLTWTRLIKDGQPHKVDWAGLIWYMVEKELLKGPQLEFCYYASHLQCLMKFQREELFIEIPRVEISIKDEEDTIDVNNSNLHDFLGQDLEKQPIESNLGQEKIEMEQIRDEDAMDFQESKEEEAGEWLLDEKNHIGEHSLQRCNLNEVGNLEYQTERKEAEEERYDLSPKSPNLPNLSSTDLIQVMEAPNNLPCSSPPGQLLDHSSEDFLPSRIDIHLNTGGPSMFGSPCKMEISPEDDVHHDILNDNQKRMRNDNPWDHKPSDFNDTQKRMRNDDPWDHKPSDFDMCMEQVQSWMNKARIMYETKEQAVVNAHMHHQILANGMQERESVIEHLHKTKFEELHTRDLEIYRLERELFVMSNLLHGYKNALKESRRAFSEYRERYQLPEEPLYKDVGESGGDVLSVLEIEKQRQQEEEENRIKCCMVEEKIKDFELSCIDQLEGYLNKVQLLGKRVSDFENEVKALKELFAKRNTAET